MTNTPKQDYIPPFQTCDIHREGAKTASDKRVMAVAKVKGKYVCLKHEGGE